MTEREAGPGSGNPSDLAVEQLALGELEGPRASTLGRQLEAEVAAGGRDRLAEIAASNREILADYPPERLAAEIRRRSARGQPTKRRRMSPIWLLGPGLAAAAVLVWLVVRDDGSTTLAERETDAAHLIDDGEPEHTRIKGGVEPHLVIDRKTDAGHERLGLDDRVRAGDLLQVSYVAAGRTEGVIVSIDGAGVVTLHHPADPSAPATLSPGDEVALGLAYELDDAPKFERFVFVTREPGSIGPLEVAAVVAAAEQLGQDPRKVEAEPLALTGEGWTQTDILLRKADADGELDPVPAKDPR